MDKKHLFRTAWTLARQAAARLGGAARAHFGGCLKAAWAVARTPAQPATVEAAPVADEVPAYAPENALRAALGPYDAMERFFDAHRTMERGLWLGAWLDGCELQQRDRHLLSVRERTYYVEFIRHDVARAFKVDRSTLQHIVDEELATLVEPVAEAAPARIGFKPPVLTSHVRGGGVGGAAWVARITGPDPKWGLARRFVSKERNTSRSGRSGQVHFTLDAPGIYELRGVQHEASVASIGNLDSGFVRVDADGSTHRMTKAAVLAAVQA